MKMMDMKTEIISRKCIKPSSPTPPHLKTFKLSLLDQITPDLHNNMTFFFSASQSGDHNHNHTISQFTTKSQLLQKYLSDILTLFYPFAGRFQDDTTVLCNDDGISFVETRTDITLSDFLRHPDLSSVDHHLVPTYDPKTAEELTSMSEGCMVLIKFVSFSCGGTALSLSTSHKLIDLATLITLLRSWSSACRGSPDPIIPDLYTAASLLPPKEIPDTTGSKIIAEKKFASRRFVFTPSKIEELKSKLFTALGYHVSRVEAVTALIWISAANALKCKTKSFMPTLMVQAVNLRTRMEPPLPESSIGNLMWMFSVIVEKEKEMELQELVKKLKGLKKSVNEKVNKFKGEDVVGLVEESLKERVECLEQRKDNLVVYICSSWCGFPLLETCDFGWGKPAWLTSIAKNLMTNTVYLMDTKEVGGVEALVHLDEEEMNLFQSNQQLLQFASVNPDIVV
ncbi:vinorine synthase-like [Quillaja saponaria]|uniref:Vinorine synthase-like n=1 Tax=Quillaja saponaria TaxID=32244 RepID=A0AAD7LUW2_QUISA|nr:vinorine synthase-like [Quillaja saponaria]